ncbi:hypothetical protein CCACVL1_24842 [Corchorus capsularis]|uniref:Uncharacterized protein n=1 Tax=Corchorus capsularis TaxID=210143 RepID=A0A1R3GMX2_COCAP|nr:hypothetical protein CCACVL1_24842 [Corchorus capsularis]
MAVSVDSVNLSSIGDPNQSS